MWKYRIVTALVLKFVGCNCSIDFLSDAKQLSVVEKSAFADILSEAVWSIHNCSVQVHSRVY